MLVKLTAQIFDNESNLLFSLPGGKFEMISPRGITYNKFLATSLKYTGRT